MRPALTTPAEVRGIHRWRHNLGLSAPLRHWLLVFAATAMLGGSGCGKSASHVAAPSPEKRGLLSASSQLSDRIVLQHSVEAGTSMQGELVVQSRGQRPMPLLFQGCRPFYVVALTNGTIIPRPGFASVCQTKPLVISPGENRLRVTVSTMYDTCSAGEAPVTASSPACLPGGHLPPLPAGPYRAVLTGAGLALPDPPPVTVVLTAARG